MVTIGEFYLIRTRSAGVHFGTLIEKNGMEVSLSNARRLWSWNGALSLHEVASKGIDLKNSKVSVPIEEITLPEAIEIIKISSKSNLPHEERKVAFA